MKLHVQLEVPFETTLAGLRSARRPVVLGFNFLSTVRRNDDAEYPLAALGIDHKELFSDLVNAMEVQMRERSALRRHRSKANAVGVFAVGLYPGDYVCVGGHGYEDECALKQEMLAFDLEARTVAAAAKRFQWKGRHLLCVGLSVGAHGRAEQWRQVCLPDACQQCTWGPCFFGDLESSSATCGCRRCTVSGLYGSALGRVHRDLKAAQCQDGSQGSCL